jgi:hypothetical protein
MNLKEALRRSQSTTTTDGRCGYCGAVVLSGFNSCRDLFNAVLEREYTDPAFGESHLFTVDAYALQHSEQHRPRSNAFHLMRLCWLIEHNGNPTIRQVQRGGRAFYDAREQFTRVPSRPDRDFSHAREEAFRQLPFLAPPASRGELTVVSVAQAQTAEEHAKYAEAWGRSVWEAWSEHHSWAREQVMRWFQPR